MNLPRKKHRNLAQGVIEQFASDIHSGILKPGDKLPTESAIMALHGVSRTVVREAISHLQASGQVETRHGIGTFVLEAAPATGGLLSDTIVTLRDVLAILELRICLETEAAALAAARRTDEQAAQLGIIVESMRASGEQGGAVGDDVQFHLLIAQATGNKYFVEILAHLGSAIIPRARVNAAKLAQDEPGAFTRRVHHEHEEIWRAIERQDGEGARAAMRTHLSNSRERLRRAHETMTA
ncbi:FadR/GntR family transcriptional regulator [Massilia sp. TSP1-1-2]|uniref:FadR/GntR family transcriptional regulator n=1 Tax=unclassified Massilia TaxID=2609279 RepID=UPI003CEA6A34